MDLDELQTQLAAKTHEAEMLLKQQITIAVAEGRTCRTPAEVAAWNELLDQAAALQSRLTSAQHGTTEGRTP